MLQCHRPLAVFSCTVECTQRETRNGVTGTVPNGGRARVMRSSERKSVPAHMPFMISKQRYATVHQLQRALPC